MYNSCKWCGESIIENLSNPAIHYSGGSDFCIDCKVKQLKKVDDWYQDSSGEYLQVTEDMVNKWDKSLRKALGDEDED